MHPSVMPWATSHTIAAIPIPGEPTVNTYCEAVPVTSKAVCPFTRRSPRSTPKTGSEKVTATFVNPGSVLPGDGETATIVGGPASIE